MIPVITALRPKQWIKNGLVLAAPAVAGTRPTGRAVLHLGLAFIAFCLVASATYLVNDINDREFDRLHERKRHRPIASGALGVPVAWAMAAVVGGLGLGVGAVLDVRFLIVLLVYGLLGPLYSTWLKNQPVIEIGCVAAGFVLRAIAGAVVTDLPISRWFLIVAGAGSVFMVAGKRHSEIVLPGGDRSRPVLKAYTVDYLRFVWRTAASVAVMGYALWAFEEGSLRLDPVWAQLSVVPFSFALLRYGLVVERGEAGAPEDVAFGDRLLQALAVSWGLAFAVGVLLGRS